jgi:hypothetical protein
MILVRFKKKFRKSHIKRTTKDVMIFFFINKKDVEQEVLQIPYLKKKKKKLLYFFHFK